MTLAFYPLHAYIKKNLFNTLIVCTIHYVYQIWNTLDRPVLPRTYLSFIGPICRSLKYYSVWHKLGFVGSAFSLRIDWTKSRNIRTDNKKVSNL
jgi:hypothetical protein